ncbi:hypothetical protein [Bacillus paralicheniformis]|uniref:hypothetical protein n=1 Tax=Bacillus paralicheniformis TaxID=1648923 RepID=UPI0021D117BD|nr:hypothetical protein [Bacillus paralicheniformis]MCU4668551.1 hypothetical protein [Bacillus paralicheniformis]
MFSLFKNTCEQCEFYSEYKTANMLHKDKTVTRGEVLMRYCKKMKDELRDMEKCELFQLRGGKITFTEAADHYFKTKRENLRTKY